MRITTDTLLNQVWVENDGKTLMLDFLPNKECQVYVVYDGTPKAVCLIGREVSYEKGGKR